MVVWDSDSKCVGHFCERLFTAGHGRVEIYETASNISQGLQVIALLYDNTVRYRVAGAGY